MALLYADVLVYYYRVNRYCKEDVSAVLSSMTSSFFLNLIVFCEIKLLVVGMIMTPCIRMGYKVDL